MVELKRCPFRPCGYKKTDLVDQPIVPTEFAVCIQDKCAMWRTEETRPNTMTIVLIGYCGLVGKP